MKYTEIWLNDDEQHWDSPVAQSKRPTVLTLVDHDKIAVRMAAAEVELNADTIYRICRLAFKDVLSTEQCQRIVKLTSCKEHQCYT